MGQLVNAILCSGRLAKMHADNLLKNVKPEFFGSYAKVGGVTVESNHGAFVYGHLSLYFPKVLTQLGQPTFANPPMFEELFSAGKQCTDDSARTKYPPMDAILSHFNLGYEAAMAAITRATDAELARQNPAEGRFRELFPTAGDVITFIMGAHIESHLGQVSAWRRMMGLGSANA